MSERPIVRVPLWASDANFAAGSEPWSGTSTKVDPGTGAEADGWIPQTRPAPQHMNWLDNAYGQWLRYLQDVPLLNWQQSFSASTAYLDIGYRASSREYVVGLSDAHIRVYSPQLVPPGFEMNVTGNNVALFTDDDDDTLMFFASSTISNGGLGDPNVYTYDGALAVTLKATAPFDANFSARHCVHVASLDRWIIGGLDVSDFEDVWIYTSDNNGAAWTSRLTDGGTTFVGITMLAVKQGTPPLIIAVGNDTVGPTDVWTSADGITWTAHNGIEDVATDPILLGTFAVYSVNLGLFVMATRQAVPSIYTSPDGISWTLRGGVPDDATAFALATGLCEVGGTLVLMCVDAEDRQTLFMSKDSGDTWRKIGDVAGTTDETPSGAIALAGVLKYKGGRAIVTFGDTVGGTGTIAFSLAT